MERPLDFFFSGGTSTHLAAIAPIGWPPPAARCAGGPSGQRSLMLEQNNRPFVGKPVELACMWRDRERRLDRCRSR